MFARQFNIFTDNVGPNENRARLPGYNVLFVRERHRYRRVLPRKQNPYDAINTVMPFCARTMGDCAKNKKKHNSSVCSARLSSHGVGNTVANVFLKLTELARNTVQ